MRRAGDHFSTIVFFFLFLSSLVLVSSCGGPPPAPREGGGASSLTHSFQDWDEVDWKFWRHSLAKASFKRLRPHEAFHKYREQTNFLIGRPPVSLAEFQRLDPAEQEARRREAAQRMEQAGKLEAVLNRGWELWTLTYENGEQKAVPDEVILDEMGPITRTLKHLRAAVALDPSDPVACYDLAYFSGLVGDEDLRDKALIAGLEALSELSPGGGAPRWRSDGELGLLRLRLLLDQAWALRRDGYFDRAGTVVQQIQDQMKNDGRGTYDEAVETNILLALLAADRGDVHFARKIARELPEIPLFLQPSAHMGFGGKPPLVKSNMRQVESRFARDWIWIMTLLQEGEKEQILQRLTEMNYRLELPVHLNHRYWHDMGEVLEQLGERGRSRLAYGFSILYRPYLAYYPLQGSRGNARVTDQIGCGRAYYQSYRHFYVGGSLFSYAANRLVAMDMAQDKKEREAIGREGVAALSACIRKGLRPAAALALRGQVNYRLYRDQEALADLAEADRLLVQMGRPSSDVIKLAALIHFQHEEFEASLSLLDRYTRLNPEDGFGWRTAGVALTNLGRYDEARSTMERALRVDPSSLEGRFNLGLLYLKTGDREGARLVQAELESRFPDHPQTARFRELVAADPGRPLEMAVTPVEIKTSVDEDRWFLAGEDDGGVNLLGQLSEPDLRGLAATCRHILEQQPSAGNRLRLARVLAQLEDWKEVTDLLAPLWPDGLTRAEAMELLRADLVAGRAGRAMEMVQRLNGGRRPVPDVEFWALVGAICEKSGATEEARQAAAVVRSFEPGD